MTGGGQRVVLAQASLAEPFCPAHTGALAGPVQSQDWGCPALTLQRQPAGASARSGVAGGGNAGKGLVECARKAPDEAEQRGRVGCPASHPARSPGWRCPPARRSVCQRGLGRGPCKPTSSRGQVARLEMSAWTLWLTDSQGHDGWTSQAGLCRGPAKLTRMGLTPSRQPGPGRHQLSPPAQRRHVHKRRPAPAPCAAADRACPWPTRGTPQP